jgi:hypothetical protein
MKTLRLLIAFVLLLAAALPAGAQDTVPTKQQKKQQKKEEKKAKLEKDYQATKSLLENRQFILQAQYLADRSGTNVPVNQDLNFIIVDSATAVIQLGTIRRVGMNDVGGITVQGDITKWSLKFNEEQKTADLYISLNTKLGGYDIAFAVNTSGFSTAYLTGSANSTLEYGGQILNFKDSSAYLGQDFYRHR